jgi:hypothetical protein
MGQFTEWKKVGILICGLCFLNLKVALQRLPQGKKKVVHGHSCKIFAHDLSPDREIMDKGGCCNLQCSGLKK